MATTPWSAAAWRRFATATTRDVAELKQQSPVYIARQGSMRKLEQLWKIRFNKAAAWCRFATATTRGVAELKQQSTL
jgi:hypothetical protein